MEDHPLEVYVSKYPVVELYLSIPATAEDGRSAVVPLGTMIASVAFTSRVAKGVSVPIPILLVVVSTKRFAVPT